MIGVNIFHDVAWLQDLQLDGYKVTHTDDQKQYPADRRRSDIIKLDLTTIMPFLTVNF